jgi:hypothetical protein
MMGAGRMDYSVRALRYYVGLCRIAEATGGVAGRVCYQE